MVLVTVQVGISAVTARSDEALIAPAWPMLHFDLSSDLHLLNLASSPALASFTSLALLWNNSLTAVPLVHRHFIMATYPEVNKMLTRKLQERASSTRLIV